MKYKVKVQIKKIYYIDHDSRDECLDVVWKKIPDDININIKKLSKGDFK